jgi:hypothetical protein
LLKAIELWGLVGGEEVKPKANHLAKLFACEIKERKALNLLVQGLFDNQLMSVKKEIITKGIWEAFQKWHVDKGFANKIFLTCKFFMFRMDPLKMMEHHLNKLGVMVDELDTIEVTSIPKEVKMMVMLMNLLDNYQILITSLESSKVEH